MGGMTGSWSEALRDELDEADALVRKTGLVVN